MSPLSIPLPLKRCSPSSFLVLLCFMTFSEASRHLTQVQINSLLPQEDYLTCKHSPREKKEGVVSLKVVHRHGPCSTLNSTSTKHGSPSLSDLLQLDQDRVDWIHARLSGQSVAGGKAELESNSINLPAQSGASIGSGNYIVSVGLGTPRKDLSLMFDTGSDFTWTQCKPCLGSCYSQVDSIFDPSSSSSYVNITCNSAACNKVRAATSAKPGCASSTCVYGIQYGDRSFSVGFFAEERLSLSSTDCITGFLFGCGENNQGLFRGAAGLIGLGRNKLSLVSQAAYKYGNYFSYCLPTSSSSTGHLTLGQGGTTATSFSYTPLLTKSRSPTFYFVDLQSISVGGQQLPISPAVFSAAGTIIDSGTVISRLPQQAYSALSAAFKKYMSQYPSAPASGVLDTCFDFSKYSSVLVPKVKLYFGGGGVLDVPVAGRLYGTSISQLCLPFAANTGLGVGIVGNMQQKGLDVVYDVAAGRIGFGPNGC